MAMRINKYVALATGLSRRVADSLISEGKITVNGAAPEQGYSVKDTDVVKVGDRLVKAPAATTTIIMNKPTGLIVSRDGQGNKTIYDILPKQYHALKPVGRLDKYSSGLLLLTNDGTLANELMHPSKQKIKVYEVWLNGNLEPLHRQMISDHGVRLLDGPSKFELTRLREGNDRKWTVTMREGRNRQIRRTFQALGYDLTRLHRTKFGDYELTLAAGRFKELR